MIRRILGYVMELFSFLNIKQLYKNLRFNLVHMDRLTMLLIIALNVIGFLMIFSSSSMSPWYRNVAAGNPYYFIKKQTIWLFLSTIIYIYILAIPYKKLYNYAWVIGILNIVFLLGVLVIGVEYNNAKSWYDLKFMTLQPAEFVKIGIILFLAWYFDFLNKLTDFFTNLKTPYKNFAYFGCFILIPIGYIILIFGLVFIQPDLGSAMALMFIGFMIFVVSGVSIKYLSVLISLGISALLPTLYYIITKTKIIKSYQLMRFKIWLDPFIDPLGSGYQLINGYVAIALGGVFGVGLGNSEQKLGFIPEPYNDFIATIIAEEAGLLGIILVVMIYLLLAVRSLYIAYHIEGSIFSSLIIVGISTMIFMQAFINLGGVSGLIPLTGITLPFISYGGSSLMSMFIGIGLLQNISAAYNSSKRLG